MGIFSWLSGRFGEADRILNGEGAESNASGATSAPRVESGDRGASRSESGDADPMRGRGDVLERAAVDDSPRPLSVERIGMIFDSHEWKWGLDDDSDLETAFDGHGMCFRAIGKSKEIFSFIAFYRHKIGAESRDDYLYEIEEWHRTRLWPKCYLREVEGDAFEAIAEVNIDFEHGVTDEQLRLQIDCAISTSLQFFGALDERFGRGKSSDSEAPADPSESEG